MSKKRMFIEVRGERRCWAFDFTGDPKRLDEWRADGLTVYVVENAIPWWALAFPGAHVWCVLQDLFNFRNPWRKQ